MKNWQLIERHGLWWAYKGELFPVEARHTVAQITLGPFPTRAIAENSSQDSCLAAKAAASPPMRLVMTDEQRRCLR